MSNRRKRKNFHNSVKFVKFISGIILFRSSDGPSHLQGEKEPS